MRKFLAGTIMALSVADVATTNTGLAMGAVEGNPFMAQLAGTWWGSAIKLIVTAIIVYVLANANIPGAVVVLALVGVAHVAVLFNNLDVIQYRSCVNIEQVHDSPFLHWKDVPGCDGLH